MICATTSISGIFWRLEKGAPERASGLPVRYSLYSTVARYSGSRARALGLFGVLHTPLGLVSIVPGLPIAGSLELRNSTRVVYTT